MLTADSADTAIAALPPGTIVLGAAWVAIRQDVREGVVRFWQVTGRAGALTHPEFVRYVTRAIDAGDTGVMVVRVGAEGFQGVPLDELREGIAEIEDMIMERVTVQTYAMSGWQAHKHEEALREQWARRHPVLARWMGLE